MLAVLVARALTRWVLRPLDGLERAVAEMTEGVAGLPADVAGPPELRHFTSAFNTMAQVVRASLDRQRRLVADASHQLRNPLAAVRLRADTLEDHVAEAGRSTYGSMTAELDRLENLLQQLLRLARAEEVSGSRRVGLSAAVAESTDLDDVIERTHRVLAARRRRPTSAIALPLGPSRARGAARSPRRGAAARRRAGQRAAVRRAGHHGHRVNRRRGRHGRTVRQRRRPRACPTRTSPGPLHDSGGDETTGTERASDWPSPARSLRVMAGRSRWSARPKAACWSAIPAVGKCDRHAERPTGELSRRAFLFATAVLAAGCVGSAPGGRVRLASGERGGLYLAFAELVAKQVKNRYPDIGVDVVPTEGSVDNLARLRSGDADMGLALADVAERDLATGPSRNRTPGGGPGVRELSAGGRARFRFRAPADRP